MGHSRGEKEEQGVGREGGGEGGGQGVGRAPRAIRLQGYLGGCAGQNAS